MPVVLVVKNGDIWVHSNYEPTVNEAFTLEHYTLPTVDKLFVKLFGCAIFPQLDLQQAYQQLVVDTESSDLLTVNTHRDLFCVM